jgi:farnesyl diphosphate synthase
MHYAVMNGGKRIRPLLVYTSGEALQIDTEQLTPAAAAIELLHCFSLVHDDLPSMDDDNLRRGQPSVHIAFNEATAILAADALQSLAFHILAVDPAYRNQNNVPANLISLLAQAAGTNGMSGGQALDLAAEGQVLDQSELEHIYRLKTGKLLRACVLSVVCIAPSVSLEKRQLLERFIDAMGLAFQIKDDILDVEGHTKTIGKPAGSDEKKVKATYPSLFGLEASKQRINELLTTGLGLLEPFGKAADGLRRLAMTIAQREM